MLEYTPQILNADQILEKAKALPQLPGVYLFFDRKGQIVYVGKSRSLRGRVLSYFQNRGKHTPKTEKLVQTAVDVQTIVTASEAEALILENEKIKLHKPKFNIRLKDDKNYPYIRLSMGEEYPRLSFARNRDKKEDRSYYFGPYSSSGAVRTIIQTANKIFSLPTCKRRFPAEIGKGRPCLYHHLGRCVGVCTGKVSPEEYRKTMDEVILFLKHDHKKIISSLEKEMEAASECMEFERAARLRDQIRSLQALSLSKQVVKDLNFDADVFGVFADELGGCINLLSVREGSVVDNTIFHFGAQEVVTPESFSSILTEIYRNREMLPEKVFLPSEMWSDEVEVLADFLSGSMAKKLSFHVPIRGSGKKLLSLAEENARAATLHRRALIEKDEEVLVKLASLLSLEVLPQRIESIDISNSGSHVITAGIITVENARFCKKDYKSFSINSDKVDDTGSMYQAVSRRMKRYLDGDTSFSPLPDLILADGGAGQVSAVKRALSDAGIEIPVFGMVKDAFHKTRCLTDGEHDISIAHDGSVFQFIYGIQEEVHRFSLSRMDYRRRKGVKTSSLTKIPGIGDKKATLILKEMKSLKEVKAASEERLSQIKGISQKDARTIFEYYHNKKETES